MTGWSWWSDTITAEMLRSQLELSGNLLPQNLWVSDRGTVITFFWQSNKLFSSWIFKFLFYLKSYLNSKSESEITLAVTTHPKKLGVFSVLLFCFNLPTKTWWGKRGELTTVAAHTHAQQRRSYTWCASCFWSIMWSSGLLISLTLSLVHSSFI